MRGILLVILTLFGCPIVVDACLWDYDTLAMERKRFPEAIELITGNFVRHSETYYQWRLNDRNSKPAAAQTPLDYDDIAVALDKLGRHDEAIKKIEDKMKRWPTERVYESEANLGTFYIHAGQLEQGAMHIEKAIELNPDAHFGREIYQLLLVKYVLEQRSRGEQLPLSKNTNPGETGFASFIETSGYEGKSKAIQGILGMMRFGHYDSPMLLEALADVLMSSDRQENGNMLAARAYLMASYAVEKTDEAAGKAYRQKATVALSMQIGFDIQRVEQQLQLELKTGERLFAKIQADELAWDKAGENLDEKFAEKYYAEGQTKKLRIKNN